MSIRILLTAFLASFGLAESSAQSLEGIFAQSYSVRFLGEPSGIMEPIGGLAFKTGETNVLYLTDQTINGPGRVLKVTVTRDAQGHITAFAGSAALVSSGLTSGIPDGGLAIASNGLFLVSAYNSDFIYELRPGAATAAREVDAASLGLATGGGLQIVPANFAGAGRLKIYTEQGGVWQDAALSPDPNGAYNITPGALSFELGESVTGAGYVLGGRPGFSRGSVLLCHGSLGTIDAYDLDANGDPIPASKRPFLKGMNVPSGLAIDPVTGDALVSDGSKVLMVGTFSSAQVRVALTSPAAGASYAAPANLDLNATASQDNGNIAKVQFTANGTVIATVLEPPYFTVATITNAGRYDIAAIAFDSAGQSATSSVVTVTITNRANPLPTVQLLSPRNNQIVGACGSIDLTADASAPDGDIAAVEFYAGPVKLARVTGRPYHFVLFDPAPGAYVFTAKAIDDSGGETQSASVTVTVIGPSQNQLAVGVNAAGQPHLCFNGNNGTNYVLEASAAIGPNAAWAPVMTNRAAAGVLIDYIETAKLPRRFYRMRSAN